MLKRFFNFDIYITTTVIKVMYAIACVLLLLGGVGMLLVSLTAFGDGASRGIKAVLGALVVLLLGVPTYALLLRMMFESVLVLFKINDNLQKIADTKG
jgi:hypothetical protein